MIEHATHRRQLCCRLVLGHQIAGDRLQFDEIRAIEILPRPRRRHPICAAIVHDTIVVGVLHRQILRRNPRDGHLRQCASQPVRTDQRADIDEAHHGARSRQHQPQKFHELRMPPRLTKTVAPVSSQHDPRSGRTPARPRLGTLSALGIEGHRHGDCAIRKGVGNQLSNTRC